MPQKETNLKSLRKKDLPKSWRKELREVDKITVKRTELTSKQPYKYKYHFGTKRRKKLFNHSIRADNMQEAKAQYKTKVWNILFNQTFGIKK